MKKIHLIAIGGSAMHNLALALSDNGHAVTGSDDEIYEPARSRLAAKKLLPKAEGWQVAAITADLDFVIVGMHARADNPELLAAQALGLPIYSYPEYIYEHAKDKTRIVIAGSHGKTSTTAMLLHVFQACHINCDYLVGAQLEGFHNMVRLSDAPYMLIEGDEYLASPLQPVPKFHFYKPHIAVLTGIAWDHINVFPTFENYVAQFRLFVAMMSPESVLFYYKNDANVAAIAETALCEVEEYDTPACTMYHRNLCPYKVYDPTLKAIVYFGRTKLQVFGKHNLENLNAAYLVCRKIGISTEAFFTHIQTFKGASKRLQLLKKKKSTHIYLDFAHAPSKVRATVAALRSGQPAMYSSRLVVCLELHTFSSLNKDFLPQYADSLNAADLAYVFYSPHTLEMKRMPPLSESEVKAFFNHPNLQVVHDKTEL
ncbi:MAG: hypothetical protein RI894_2621, partial [Bacteroidota bacterium]